MKFTNKPGQNLFSAEEVTQIEALGFSITAGSISLTDFINNYFPGLHLLPYLEDIDSLLSPLALPLITKCLYYFEKEPQMLIVQYLSANHDDEKNGLALSRAFVKKQDELIVEHDYFRIPLAGRNQGAGKSLLRFSL